MQDVTAAQKKELRRRFRALRAATPLECREEWDRKIHEHLYTLSDYRSADTLLLFISYGDEIDTWSVLDDALKRGKRVAAPYCTDLEGHMAFYLLTARDDLKEGMFGIWAPDPERCPRLHGWDKAICLVPGLSFDRSGHRIGYGRGYYDRFLPQFNGVRIGLCYEQALTDALPHLSFDLPVDKIVTEAGVIEI